MKKVSAILLVMSISLSVFAGDADIQNCDAKAIDSAEIFQNRILTEIVVDNSSVTSVKKTNAGFEYLIFSVNQNGSRMRDTLVKLDAYCNVQAVVSQ